MSIFGRSYGQGISGKVFWHGKEIDVSTIQKAINHGIAYVTEDRKGYGLVLDEVIGWSTTLANLKPLRATASSTTVIAQLANEGKCVIMISSEMPEMLRMCDRICVLNEGKFAAEFAADEATQEKIMSSIVKSGAN